MSIAMSNLVWQYFHAKCDRKMLALKLADNADEYGRNIFPSVETCARYCGASTRSIQRWLKELVQVGLIQPVKYVNGGRGKACEYRINPDFIAAHDPRIPLEQRPRWEFKCSDDSVDDVPVERKKKGDTVSPFESDKRVTHAAQKGDTAQSQKGDSAVSPQRPLTVIEPNTPLPPTGGEAVKFDINELLSRLIEAHGRHSTSDTTAAHSALRRIAPDPASSERMLAALRAEASANPQWQRDDGRYRPRLSKWLRGWRSLDASGVAQRQSRPAPEDPARERERAMVAQRLAEQQRLSHAPPSPPSEQDRERLGELLKQAKAAAGVGGKVKKKG